MSSVKSYAVPDSDDEEIADGHENVASSTLKKRRSETNLQMWIKHLTILLKEEQKKVRHTLIYAFRCPHCCTVQGAQETYSSDCSS